MRAALDSLLGQTFTDFELVISDNASTDATRSICLDYAARDQRIRYVRQQRNLGVLANFQFVLNEARGQYFMWAAADDAWDPDWVSSLLTLASARSCLAFGLVQVIDENGENLQHPANNRAFRFSGLRWVRRCKYFIAPPFLGKANPIYGLCPITPLKTMGIEWLNGMRDGDMIFLFALLKRLDICDSKDVLLYKRLHQNAAGSRLERSAENESRLSKLVRMFRRGVTRPMLGQYLKASSVGECILLVLAYPLCVALFIGYEIMYEVRRKMSWRTR